jgi:hypothetical protein
VIDEDVLEEVGDRGLLGDLVEAGVVDTDHVLIKPTCQRGS